MNGPRVGALFAGYGGIELALHDVFDAEPAWFSELDAAPSAILDAHWPGVPNLGDVTKIDWSTVEPVDIIAGGSPCQDLSHAGKRKGMRVGTRSGLWTSMLEAVRVLRPPLVVWENVRGALSAEATSELEPCAGCVGGDDDGPVLRALGRVLGDLAGIGYDAAWTGLRAADVGAPHGRFRVFVLAWPVAPDTDSDEHGSFAGSDRSEDRPARSLSGLAGSVDHGYGTGGRGGPAPDTGGEAVRLGTGLRAGEPRGFGRGRPDDGPVPAGDQPPTLTLLPTPTTGNKRNSTVGRREGSEHHDGTSLGDVTRAGTWGQYAPAIARWEAITRPAPSPTEPTGKGGAQRLSPAFVEWLMGLPDGWVTDVGITRNEMLKALGNGVVPQQCAAAIRHLLTIRAEHMTKAVAS